jgi:transglutaminase-like putative cysteine protease
MNNNQYNELTIPTPTIESTHPAIVEFTRQVVGDVRSEVEQAVRLYYAVRDTIRYDPYRIDLTIPGMRASTTLSSKHGWCIPKAILLAACCRAVGIPARLGFADVRNHLSTERLRQWMGTDLFCWHGYTDILLAGKWVKATPAFNIELCQKFRLLPLEFDGHNDSLYHPFDAEGRRHMEYVRYRGVYSDLPLEEIIQTFQKSYGTGDGRSELFEENFDQDVASETQP